MLVSAKHVERATVSFFRVSLAILRILLRDKKRYITIFPSSCPSRLPQKLETNEMNESMHLFVHKMHDRMMYSYESRIRRPPKAWLAAEDT